MGLRNRAGNWHYRFQHNGEEYSGDTGLAATARNRPAAARKEVEARQLVEGGKAQQLRIQAIPFSNAARAYLEWARGEHRAKPKTYAFKRSAMASLIHYFDKLPVHVLTAGRVEAYKTYRRKDHQVKEVTIRHNLHVLSDFLRYCRKQNWLQGNPLADVKIPSDAEARRETILSFEQERVYFATAHRLQAEESSQARTQKGSVRLQKGRWYGSFFRWCDGVKLRAHRPLGLLAEEATPVEAQAVLQQIIAQEAGQAPASSYACGSLFQAVADLARIVLDQGMRPDSEVLNVRKGDVDFLAGTVRIRESKSKAGKRTLKMTSAVKQILTRRYRESPSDWLFPGKKHGAKLPLTSLYAKHEQILTEAGLSFVLYDLRHTFATRFVAYTKDVITLGKLLGHADLKTIMRYVHLAQEHADTLMGQYEEYLRSQQQAIEQQAAMERVEAARS